MAEQTDQIKQEEDILIHWKQTATFMTGAIAVIYGYQNGIDLLSLLVLYFPVSGLMSGFLNNNIRKICSCFILLLLFPILPVNGDKLYQYIASLPPSKNDPVGTRLCFCIVVAIIFFILMGIAKLVSKLIPKEMKIPQVVHQHSLLLIFALVLIGGLTILYSVINYCNGRFIQIPEYLSFLLVPILFAVTFFALLKVRKMIFDPHYAEPQKMNGNLVATKCQNITLKDVAGMDDVKEQIRLRMIEPVRNPHEAKKYGLKKGGGIMLYGPPGTGKTFLARAIAGELNVPFYIITATDIFSKYVGESEQKIKELFDTARQNPLSVVFVDEMEIMFSKRTENNIHEVTRKIISVILQEMDGFAKNKNPILILGATNTPWNIDEAFLRPGRFDIHAYVGLPDEAARKQILTQSFKEGDLKCPEHVIDYIVRKTESFSGADLTGLVTAIRQTAFDRKEKKYTTELTDDVLSHFSQSSNTEIIEKINEWHESKNTGSQKQKKKKNVECNTIKLDDVAGMEQVKKQIRMRLIDPIIKPELISQYGLKKGGGIMLYGPPGTGKTFLARAVAGELDLPFYIITPADIYSKNLGESEQNIRNIFATARKNPLSVVFVDEMESIFSKRTENNIHEVTRKVISIILQEMDGIETNKNPILFLGATNTPWNIDEAFLRPGRFDIHAFVDLPDAQARKQILTNEFRKTTLPKEDNLLDYIVENTSNYSGADLSGLVTTILQHAYEQQANCYTKQLAYERMLAYHPAPKSEILNKIREWEKMR